MSVKALPRSKSETIGWDPMDTVRHWLQHPTTQATIQGMSARLMQIIESHPSVRLPSREPNGEVHVSAWISSQREQFSPRMVALFQRKFPAVYRAIKPAPFKEIAIETIWDGVEPALRTFIIRSLAAAWAHEKIGDAVVVGQPAHEGDRWFVPIGLPRYGDNLGFVVLDDEGNVLPDRSVTKQHVLEQVKRAA